MLVIGYNNIILLPNCTMLYCVFSGPLSLRAYVSGVKFNNNKIDVNRYQTISLRMVCLKYRLGS